MFEIHTFTWMLFLYSLIWRTSASSCAGPSLMSFIQRICLLVTEWTSFPVSWTSQVTGINTQPTNWAVRRRGTLILNSTPLQRQNLSFQTCMTVFCRTRKLYFEGSQFDFCFIAKNSETFLMKFYFMFHKRKKAIQVWIIMRWRAWGQNPFIPLKKSSHTHTINC